jgi:hypothetical protein
MDGGIAMRRWGLLGLLVALPLFLGIEAWQEHRAKRDPSLTGNYEVQWKAPDGWVQHPRSPYSLFLFRHPDRRAMIRAGQAQVVDEVNPDLDSDTDGIASLLVSNTDNQRDWVAREAGDVFSYQGQRFRLVHRTGPDKDVLTAATVKGNTTLLVTMAVDEDDREHLAGLLAEFRQFLREIRLKPYPKDPLHRGPAFLDP